MKQEKRYRGYAEKTLAFLKGHLFLGCSDKILHPDKI